VVVVVVTDVVVTEREPYRIRFGVKKGVAYRSF